MASLPHGVPSRLIALHRFRFVKPFLNAACAMAARHAAFRLPMDAGWACVRLNG
jgi:hypothetical protein